MGGPGSGAKPRVYPREVVELVCGMYSQGMTVAEIRKAAPRGYRVQTILERYLPERRKAAKRNQRGPLNHMWSDDCGYQAAHLRIAGARGKAASHDCHDCGGKADDWSYIQDCPDERAQEGSPAYCLHINHYAPRCRPCHRAYDAKVGVGANA